MSNLKISEMTVASSVSAADIVPIVQGGENFSATVSQIRGSGSLLAANNLSDVGSAAAALANLGGQPLDADLTAIAALTTTTYGRSLLTPADAAAGRALLGVTGSVSRRHISGLELSAAGGSGAFTIGAGEAVNSTTTTLLSLGSVYTKNTNAWAVGTGLGGLDTGTIANGWYHVYLIYRPDTQVTDVIFSASASSPTLPTNYTLFRWIGAIKCTSSTWDAFTQIGDDVFWKTAVAGASGTASATTPALTTITGVPTGIKVRAKLNVGISVASGGTNYATVSSPDTGGQVVSADNGQVFVNGATAAGRGVVDVWTNTSAQVYFSSYFSGVSTPWTIGVAGWTVNRRDA